MQELSKFQITTIIFLLMFVFVIGAIYTNTKDAANKKLDENNNNFQQRAQEDYNYEQNIISENNNQIQNLSNRIDELSQQVNILSKTKSQERTNVRCRVYGIATPNGIIQLSPTEAIAEARNNGTDLVMTCAF